MLADVEPVREQILFLDSLGHFVAADCRYFVVVAVDSSDEVFLVAFAFD